MINEQGYDFIAELWGGAGMSHSVGDKTSAAVFFSSTSSKTSQQGQTSLGEPSKTARGFEDLWCSLVPWFIVCFIISICPVAAAAAASSSSAAPHQLLLSTHITVAGIVLGRSRQLLGPE